MNSLWNKSFYLSRFILHSKSAVVRPRWVSYSTSGTDNISERVLSVLKTIDRIDTSKDLGLDSLDMVEAIIAIEEEFGIEIPDRVADSIKTPADVVAFITEEQARNRVN
ncbi:acyl carrier protein [Mitosporidium daphniae]|uniref:Acyl carrier protein n=1 Tax=Mitosporidium daphniae TaxID=1485682 RepID=A0A098VNV2_9MICR|nr:acyl carrier protein [Mitosporidium daphniae]KGG50464.1 acyl carrier protein [Mitosporidium daphniae]|eukprot:XP_013236891.1 acyl carrier protein [Mitosporidium daphniae]